MEVTRNTNLYGEEVMIKAFAESLILVLVFLFLAALIWPADASVSITSQHANDVIEVLVWTIGISVSMIISLIVIMAKAWRKYDEGRWDNLLGQLTQINNTLTKIKDDVEQELEVHRKEISHLWEEMGKIKTKCNIFHGRDSDK